MTPTATQIKVPPDIALMQHMLGYWTSKAIYAAAELGIADHVNDNPKTATELAAATGTHAPTLYRLMRGLASVGIFEEDEDGRFQLTPLAEPLRSGPGSLRALALHWGEGPSWRAWDSLLDTVRTGETAFPRVHGCEVFEYYRDHPASAIPFNAAMVEISSIVAAAVTKAYDFRPFPVIADIGGGHGGLLTAVLDAAPESAGILFDSPSVIQTARARIAGTVAGARVRLVAGNFFESVPSAHLYLLKHIVHDWTDEQSITILRNVAQAAPAGGKVLLVESVVPRGNTPDLSKLVDLHMLVMTGGRERTAAEYGQLLDAAGLRLTRVIPTEAPLGIVEAEKR